MSRHKFASNVCEKALQHAEPEDRRILVDELIDAQDDDTTKIPMLLRDAFGNFPLQVSSVFRWTGTFLWRRKTHRRERPTRSAGAASPSLFMVSASGCKWLR